MKALLLALLLFQSERALAEDLLQTNLAMRGRKIESVEFSGDALAANAKAKFSGMANREFSPGEVRATLLWIHENGGDALIQVSATEAGSSIVLKVRVQQRHKIREIVFEGNSAAPVNALLQEIQLKEGQEFEDASAKAASQKITLYYSKLGYLASDVKQSFDQASNILRFRITEGEPTLISGLKISPLITVERKDLRARYENEIREAFGMRVGDRIQRDKVLEGVQAVKDWLREHDFLTARDPVLEYKVATDGKVNISLDIPYGPRIRYGFRGNKQFSYRELMALVGEVKEISTGADYLSAVRRRVLDAYKEIGFGNAKITTLVREEPSQGIRFISLIVNESQKITVSSLDIEGIFSMSKEDARDKLQDLGTRLVQRGFYDEAGLNRAAELFAEKLRASGYLSAKLEYVKADFNRDRSKVKISILFSEGIQTRVEKVEIVGVKSFPENEVLNVFGLKLGEPFNIFDFEKGLQSFKDRYQEIGNLSAQIVNEASENIVRYSKDNGQVFLRVEVEEGPAFRVGDIVVRGNQQTHARVVLRELPFISGDLLTTPLLNEAEDNLRKLNLFASVIVRPIDHPGADDIKDILILVDESQPGTFDITPGLRNDLGMRLGFELGYQNLGGWNRSVYANAIFNRRLQDYYGRGDNDYRRLEYNLNVGFREPYLAEWPVALTTNLGFIRRQYTSFDANIHRFTTAVKRDLSRYLSGFLEYSYEQIDISNVRAPYNPAIDTRLDYIGTITPGIIIDSRRNTVGQADPFNPTKGIYSVNRLEVASHAFGSAKDIAYYKASSFNSAYFNLYEGIVLALAMNVGWERSNAFDKPIPSYKLFRLGGLGSIRGYNEDGIEVDTTKIISGALGMLNYRAEFRVPVRGNLGTALFLDAGNLMVDRMSLDLDKLRTSVGAGLRYKTPVGPLLLDFAWRVRSDASVGDTCVTSQTLKDRTCENKPTDRYKVHFAIGIF